MATSESIELRSEKVRSIVSKVPPSLATGGTLYISILLLALFLTAAIIPYPNNIYANLIITSIEKSHVCAEILIPYRYITQIGKSTKIVVEMEGYASQKFGFTIGEIETCDNKVINLDDNSYFRVYLTLKTPLKYNITERMKGIATITITDKNILQYILTE